MPENHLAGSVPLALKVSAISFRSAASPAVVACVIAAPISSARFASDLGWRAVPPGDDVSLGVGAGLGGGTGVGLLGGCDPPRAAVDDRYGTSGRGLRSATSAARLCSPVTNQRFRSRTFSRQREPDVSART